MIKGNVTKLSHQHCNLLIQMQGRDFGTSLHL